MFNPANIYKKKPNKKIKQKKYKVKRERFKGNFEDLI